MLIEYKPVFDGIGRLVREYHLLVDKSIHPVLHQPRKVPIALKAQLKGELDRLENLKLRFCFDPQDLNKTLKQSYYPLPTIEEVLPQLTKAKVFSNLIMKARC